MKKVMPVFIAIFFILFNCIYCDKNGEKTFYSLYTLEDSLSLEFTSESVVSIVWNILFNEENIYIIQSKNILMYDSNGKFIKKMERIGNGPGEYMEITWADLNPGKQIVVYDNTLKKIIIFDSTLVFKEEYFFREESKNYLSFVVDKNLNYYFYNRDIFSNPLTIDVYNVQCIYIKSYCKFPYNSMIQHRLGGNRNLVYASDENKLFITHIYDPIIKMVDLNLQKELPPIILKNDFWKPVDEQTVRTLFPLPSANPRPLYKYLKNKVKIWRLFYAGNGKILIEYWLPGRKFILQLYDSNKNVVVHRCTIPKKLGEVEAVKDNYLYFIKFHSNDPDKNPSILKFKIN